jgi:endonuclease YncB( thermonuclease family)
MSTPRRGARHDWRGRLFLLALFVCGLASPAMAGEFSGRVVSVIDGGSIRVLNGKRVVKVRLYGIDCPETKQPYGKQAKKALSRVIFGKVITIKEKETDRGGRLVAVVLAQDGRDVNRGLVKAGWCWADEDSSSDYAKEMQEAREAKLGLWQDPHPIRPEDWRKAKKRKLNPEKLPIMPEKIEDGVPMEF